MISSTVGMSVVLLLCVLGSSVSAVAARFKSVEEWTLWKDDHKKEYVNYKVKIQVFIISFLQMALISIGIIYLSNLAVN